MLENNEGIVLVLRKPKTLNPKPYPHPFSISNLESWRFVAFSRRVHVDSSHFKLNISLGIRSVFSMRLPDNVRWTFDIDIDFLNKYSKKKE